MVKPVLEASALLAWRKIGDTLADFADSQNAKKYAFPACFSEECLNTGVWIFAS
jgi:hypothetical protein